MPFSRGIRTYAAGLTFVAFLSSVPAQAGPVASGATSPALSSIRIENFGEINEHYYRGAQPKGDDFRALAGVGVKMMIDLAAEGDPAEEANARAAGISFVRIPMTTHQIPSPAVIAQFLKLVNDPANQPVYVHCIGGKHRTGVMTAIYRMTVDGWNAARAFAEMKHYKFGSDFLHPEFKDFVNGYVAAPAAMPVKQGGS
jgi:tyrosine-protein phosphatase SIW14